MKQDHTLYERWVPFEATTWPYRRLVIQYNQINRLMMAHTAARKFTYSNLKGLGATWEDKVNAYLDTGIKGNNKLTLKCWSNQYQDFENWCRLNAVMALTSAFEAYLESALWLAIESDPGLLIKSPHSVDGIHQLKHDSKVSRDLIEKKVEGCTRGDWQSRMTCMELLIGSLPNDIKKELGNLEKLRILRNQIGHAFGRNIQESRDYSRVAISPIAKVSIDKWRKIQSLIRRVSHQMDDRLNNYHIGLYPYLYTLHINFQKIESHRAGGDRFVALKTILGGPEAGLHSYPKSLCRWLIDYYDKL